MMKLSVYFFEVVVISFMALAVYYFRKMASNVQGPPETYPERVEHMPEGGIPTAVAMRMDPVTAEAPFSKVDPVPPPYAPHTSGPYAPHASAPPLEEDYNL
jgi:hypothetical protein